MIVCDRLDNYCYPIELKFDSKKLIDDVQELFQRLNINEDTFTSKLSGSTPAITCNLNHLPELQGNDRWSKYRADHRMLHSIGIDEGGFTKFLTELTGLYLYESINTLLAYHSKKFGTEFIGRCQLIWSTPSHCYKMHRDIHTTHRYHIPIYTDDNFFFIFEKEYRNIDVLHMPADGRVWYLNPVDVKHTVSHCGTTPRMHIILTSKK